MFPATVAAVFPPETSAPEVTQGGEEEQDNRSPHETESHGTDLGGLTVTAKGVAALDEDTTVSRISNRITSYREFTFEYSRHHSGSYGLECQGDVGKHARNVANNPNAHSDESRKERQNAKEQGDEHEREDEARSNEVVVVAVNSQIHPPSTACHREML